MRFPRQYLLWHGQLWTASVPEWLGRVVLFGQVCRLTTVCGIDFLFGRMTTNLSPVANLYVALFDSLVWVPQKTGHGWEGFYFGENGEHTWFQVSKAIGDALVYFGIASESEPTPFTTEELVKYFGSEKQGFAYGANARCRANRAHAIGWKPKFTTDDMLKSIRLAVEAILEKQNEGALE